MDMAKKKKAKWAGCWGEFRRLKSESENKKNFQREPILINI